MVLSSFKRLEAEFFHQAVRSSVSGTGINLYSETTLSVLRPSIRVRKSLPYFFASSAYQSQLIKRVKPLVKAVKVWTDDTTAALQKSTQMHTHNIPLLSFGPLLLFLTLLGNEANKSQYSCRRLDFSQPTPSRLPAGFHSIPCHW